MKYASYFWSLCADGGFMRGCLEPHQQLLVPLQRSTHTVGNTKMVDVEKEPTRERILFATEIPLK